MKGIVFTLLQQVVTDEYGEEAWDSLLEAAGVEGAYTSVATYSDDEMQSLVDAASKQFGLSGDEVLVWLGRNSIPILADRYPRVFEGHTSSGSFVLKLNDFIHPEVRKLFPGAYVPVFDYEELDGRISLSYTSKRKMCSFAEGLLMGSADYFDEQGDVAHDKCLKGGDPECVLTYTFAKRSEGI